MRFLGTVRSFFFTKNTSSAKKTTTTTEKKNSKDITFTKKVWKTIVPWGNTDLFLTGHNSETKKNRCGERFSVFYSPLYPLSDELK